MNYMFVLKTNFPNVNVSCVGEENIYSNLVWLSGEILPSEAELQASYISASKDKMWECIKHKREFCMAGGYFVSGKWFHSDIPSRIQQLGLVALKENIPENLQWKTMDGTFILMTPELAMSIFVNTAISDTIIFRIAEVHNATMRSSTEDASNYDFMKNWPQTYGDSIL